MKNKTQFIPMAGLLLLLITLSGPVTGFCGFGLPVDTTITVTTPACNCPSISMALKRTTPAGCETKCISTKFIKQFINRGWTYGCCQSARLSNGSGTESSLRIYPNPATDVLHIEYSVPVTGKIVLSLLDASGRQLRLLEESAPSGGMGISLPLDDLAAGMYYLRLDTPGVSQVQKFIISGK